MFFIGTGSSILPYLLYLVFIWGMLLLNGVLDVTLKNTIEKETGEIHTVKNTSPSLEKQTCHYEQQLKPGQTSGAYDSQTDDHLLHIRLKPVIFRLPPVIYDINQGIKYSFWLRGPPYPVSDVQA